MCIYKITDFHVFIPRMIAKTQSTIPFRCCHQGIYISLHTFPQFHDVDPQTNLVFYSTFSLSSLILLLLFKSNHPSLSSHSMCFISQDLPLESTKYMTKQSLLIRLQFPSFHKRNESQGSFTRGCTLLMGEQAWGLQGGP